MNKATLYTAGIMALIFSSCSSTKMSVQVTPENHATSEYIEKYSAIAVSEMRRTGIPASIKLAQGMIESDYGRSRLARQANNHFGIKCHSTWDGPVIYHDDDARGECFRKYNTAEQSFRDHSDFLVNGSRYKDLFLLDPTDYKGWARGLKKAGYATNPAYADMLIKKIEENSLYLFDTSRGQVSVGTGPGKTTAPVRETVAAAGSRYSASVAQRVMQRNRVDFIIIGSDDTFETITRDFGLLSWELERYNEKPVEELLIPGNTLFLQPKRKKAEPGIRYHIVREGETMYDVSQLYAIRLHNLYVMNFMDEGTEPETGRKLNLR